MLLLATLGAIVALSSPVIAIPTSKVSVAQKLARPPQGWTKHNEANVNKASSMVQLRIHLEQPRISEFQEMAMKVCYLLNQIDSFSYPFARIIVSRKFD